MARITGNETYYAQLHATMKAEHLGMDEAELVLFEKICRGLLQEGKNWGEIRQHFLDVYKLGYHAFYTRLRKVRQTVPLI